jgi:chemotaxis protein CheX
MIETELLQELSAQVWLTTLNLDVIASVRSAATYCDELLCAAVTIDGGWDGQIQVMCSRSVAAAAASSLFGTAVDMLVEADLFDAIGEVANVTGGAIKPLLPGECQLHPPVVGPIAQWPADEDTAFLSLGDEFIAIYVQSAPRS